MGLYDPALIFCHSIGGERTLELCAYMTFKRGVHVTSQPKLQLNDWNSVESLLALLRDQRWKHNFRVSKDYRPSSINHICIE